MNKPKLLIALGCSFTEGVGCYITELLTPNITADSEQGQIAYLKSLDRFHQNGWPPLLAKKLGYDKVINLGHGGSANSAHIKRLVELFRFNPKIADGYEVTVIWLMTYSHRISFYGNGRIKSWCKVSNEDTIKDPLFFEYIKQSSSLDYMLETIFYLECLEKYCQASSFNLLYGTLEGLTQQTFFEKFINSPSYLNRYSFELTPMNIPEMTSFCHHPNEKGYAWMADLFFDIIRTNFPNLLGAGGHKELISEYRGSPRVWE